MVTRKHVAREAQVSEAAVTHVLNGSRGTIRVSAATRERIRNAARRLGYTPHPHAVALKQGRTRTIGFLAPNPTQYLSHPYGMLVLKQLLDVAREKHYRLLIHPDLSEALDARLVDGCLVLGCPAECAEVVGVLARQTPVLTLGRELREVIPGAVHGEFEGGSWNAIWESAARYLCGLGHRHIALVEATEESHPRNAFAAFRAEVARLEVPATLEFFVNGWRLRRYPTVEALCRLRPLPTAACVFDDDYARALIARLAVDGRRVPADVSIFSCQTLADADDTRPRLTGVDRNAAAAHGEMLRRFIAMIESGERASEIRVRLEEPRFIVRESCAPPRGAVGAAG